MSERRYRLLQSGPGQAKVRGGDYGVRVTAVSECLSELVGAAVTVRGRASIIASIE